MYFSLNADGKLEAATTMEHAILEVVDIPNDYDDEAALHIADSVFKSGVIVSRARVGTRGGPTRVSWAVLVEKGIAADVLEHEDA